MSDRKEPLVRAAEAARLIGIPESTFRSWLTRRALIKPVILSDGSKRFRATDVEWLREEVRLNTDGR